MRIILFIFNGVQPLIQKESRPISFAYSSSSIEKSRGPIGQKQTERNEGNEKMFTAGIVGLLTLSLGSPVFAAEKKHEETNVAVLFDASGSMIQKTGESVK